MKIECPVREVLLPSLLAALLLAACSGENPDAMLASAKDYLAKNDSKAAVIQIKNALQKNPDLAEARYLLGKALLESGDAVSAEIELRKAISLKAPAGQTTPLLARAVLQQGHFKKLIDEFGKVQLGSAEGDAELQTTIGIAQASLGDADAAEKALATALALKADHAPALLTRARIKAVNGDLPGAIAIVDPIIAKAPANAEAWKLKGDFLAGQRELEPAIAAYGKAVAIKPDFVMAHAGLVSLFMRSNKSDEAGAQIELLKKAAPKHPMATLLEAQYAFQKRDTARARDLVQQVLRVAPESHAGLQLAGAVEYEAKSYSQAEAHLGKLVRLAPDSVEARRLLTMTHLRMGRPGRAMAVLEPLLGKIDQDSNMLALAGEVSIQTGDAAKAEQFFAKAAALDPKNVPKRTALALTHLAKGSDGAFAELEQIAALDSGIQADMALIASSLRRNQFDKALKAIDAFEKKQPNNSLAHHLRGGALLGKKDVAGARRSFERALSVNAAYFPSAATLAALDMTDKKPNDAKKRFESILAADPKNVQAQLALANLALQTGGSPDEVAALIGKAVAANPAEPAPRLALIEFHWRNKDVKKAVTIAQEAVAAIPGRPELLEALGRAQVAAGESNQALSTFGKLVGLQPTSPIPHLRIAEAHMAGKDREAAMQSLRKAIELKPDLIEAQRGLIGLQLATGAKDQALALARDIQKQRPKESVGYGLEGDARAAMKSWPEAAAAYRAGLKVAPSTELAVKLHSVLGFANKNAEADGFATSWLKEHPKDGLFRLHLGDRALAAQDWSGAAQQYRAVADAQPNNAIALNNLAWVALKQKDPKALEYSERAIKLAPNNPAFMDTLAVILLEKGEADRAVDLLKKAVGGAPQLPGIRLNLAKALIKAGDKAGARTELDALTKLGDKFPDQAEVTRVMKDL